MRQRRYVQRLAEWRPGTAPRHLTTEINTPYIKAYARYVQTPLSTASFIASFISSDKPYIVSSKPTTEFLPF